MSNKYFLVYNRVKEVWEKNAQVKKQVEPQTKHK